MVSNLIMNSWKQITRILFKISFYFLYLDSLEEEKDLMSDASQNTSEDASKKDNANEKTTSRTSSFRLRSKVTEVKKTVMPENNHNLPSPTIKLTKEEKERLKNDVMLMNLEAVGLQDLIH